RLSKQQTTSTHVAPADESDRKRQTLAEDRQQYGHVLGGGDAAEQDDIARRADLSEECAGALFKRAAIARVIGVNMRAVEGAERLLANQGLRRSKAGVGGNDVHAGSDDGMVAL